MAPHDLRRPFKRPLISDQERRRQQSLLRQAQNRLDAQRHARFLASTAFSLSSSSQTPEPETEPIHEPEPHQNDELDVLEASKLKGAEARKWFAKQLMHPEWMIDIPENLTNDWYFSFLIFFFAITICFFFFFSI